MSELTTVEVYEMAAAIGREFEKIIDKNGSETVAELTPYVVSALEKLEKYAVESEQTKSRETSLVARLKKAEKIIERNEDERNYLSKDVKDSEEKWREETKQLLVALSEIQRENDEIRNILAEKEGSAVKEHVRAEENLMVVMKLKEAVDKQRDEIRMKNRELNQKIEDIDALQSQLSVLVRINQDLRTKQSVLQSQAQTLIEEKSHLQASADSMRIRLDHLQNRMEPSQSLVGESEKPFENKDTAGGGESEEEGKMFVDENDPNRPRYTLEELKSVLYERNELKKRLFDTEEELIQLKLNWADNWSEYYLKSDHREEIDGIDGSSTPSSKSSNPNKSPNSGIRKFFSFFTSKSNNEEQKNLKDVSKEYTNFKDDGNSPNVDIEWPEASTPDDPPVDDNK